MSVTDELIQNAESHAATFDKGDLPLPPGRKVAIVACMDAPAVTEDSPSRRSWRDRPRVPLGSIACSVRIPSQAVPTADFGPAAGAAGASLTDYLGAATAFRRRSYAATMPSAQLRPSNPLSLTQRTSQSPESLSTITQAGSATLDDREATADRQRWCLPVGDEQCAVHRLA